MNKAGLMIALIAGAGIGAFGVQFLNKDSAPLSSEKTSPRERVESFFVDLPAHGIAVTHGGRIGLQPGPPGIPALDEPNIQNGLALLIKVRNAEGNVVGFASELEIFPEPTRSPQGLEPDTTWETDWTVVIPGRGGLFLHQQEHTGAGAPMFQHVAETGTDWVGEMTITTSAGPRADKRGVIVGGWGEFENAQGSFLEVDRFTRFTVQGELIGTVELRIFRED